MKSSFNYKEWMWLGYPIVVVMTIIFSLQYVMSGQIWASLSAKQEKVAENRKRADNLSKKLAVLRSANLSDEATSLGYLLTILPQNKQVPLLLGGLAQAASSAGVVVQSYKGAVVDVTASTAGELKFVVTFAVSDAGQLARLLTNLELQLPLIRVVDVKYGQNRAEMTVQGLWQALAKVSINPDASVGETKSLVNDIRTKFANFSPVPMSTTDLRGSEVGAENPF